MLTCHLVKNCFSTFQWICLSSCSKQHDRHHSPWLLANVFPSDALLSWFFPMVATSTNISTGQHVLVLVSLPRSSILHHLHYWHCGKQVWCLPATSTTCLHQGHLNLSVFWCKWFESLWGKEHFRFLCCLPISQPVQMYTLLRFDWFQLIDFCPISWVCFHLFRPMVMLSLSPSPLYPFVIS